MISVITGDIVGSRGIDNQWIEVLKNALNQLSDEKSVSEIFRGDSFQVVLKPKEALLSAIYIKACIKTIKNADVRLSIGIGKGEKTSKITEANGEAYVYSGQALDGLKLSKINLIVKSPSVKFDEDINLNIRLALIAMDTWAPVTAGAVKFAIENRGLKQDEIAKRMGKSQSSVSEALKRAHYNEIMDVEAKFRNQIAKLK